MLITESSCRKKPQVALSTHGIGCCWFRRAWWHLSGQSSSTTLTRDGQGHRLSGSSALSWKESRSMPRCPTLCVSLCVRRPLISVLTDSVGSGLCVPSSIRVQVLHAQETQKTGFFCAPRQLCVCLGQPHISWGWN